jgi:hypothetical protein
MTKGVTRSTSAGRLLFVASVLLLAVGSVVLLLVLSGRTETSSEVSSEKATAEKPSPSGAQAPSSFMASGPRFASLDQMVATSDLVVMGTVKDVRPGETDAAGTPDQVQHLNAVVSVDEVLKGSAPDGPIVVKTLEPAYSGPGRAEWRRPGERVLLFLSHSREQPGLYIPAAISYDQTAYVIQPGGALRATVPDDPLSARVASLSVPELRREAEQAKSKAARGEVEPLQF